MNKAMEWSAAIPTSSIDLDNCVCCSWVLAGSTCNLVLMELCVPTIVHGQSVDFFFLLDVNCAPREDDVLSYLQILQQE